uniref:Uncharacterized protein n=1 Tax=Lygus hesperus TaxID=30085 RepID=A0A0A9WNH3_LYGHE
MSGVNLHNIFNGSSDKSSKNNNSCVIENDDSNSNKTKNKSSGAKCSKNNSSKLTVVKFNTLITTHTSHNSTHDMQNLSLPLSSSSMSTFPIARRIRRCSTATPLTLHRSMPLITPLRTGKPYKTNQMHW